MMQAYNAKHPGSQIDKAQINILPNHFNMDGCLLGKRGPWFIDTLTEKFGSEFVTFNHDKSKIKLEFEARITKKQLFSHGASFAEKFIYHFDASGQTQPKVVESWTSNSQTSLEGESSTEFGKSLNDIEQYHRIFTLGDNEFAQQVKNVKYQLNPAGFVEYQLPERLDPTRKFHKVFRGPLPESTPAE